MIMARVLLIEGGDNIALPGSIRLDTYRGRERVFVLFSREPLRFETIRKSIENDRRGDNEAIVDVEQLETLSLHRGFKHSISDRKGIRSNMTCGVYRLQLDC